MNIPKEKLDAVVKRHKPKGVTIKWYRPKTLEPKALKGGAWWEQKLILSPKVGCRDTLYLFLHEAGHFKTGHLPLNLPSHVEEYEAELWAMNTMKMEGIPVSKKMLKEIKRYVRECIRLDEKEGIEIRPHIRKWAGL